MKSVLRLAAFVLAAAVSAATGQAAILSFSGLATPGIVSPSTPAGFLDGASSFSLLVNYNESATSTTTSINSSVLTIFRSTGSPKVFLGAQPGSQMLFAAGNPTTLTVSMNYLNIANAGGAEPVTGSLTLNFTGGGQLPNTALTAANISQLLAAGTVYSGTITGLNGLFAPGAASFNGAIPVPEPGSIGLLTGLGMVAGRRIWRRRQQKKAEAAA